MRINRFKDVNCPPEARQSLHFSKRKRLKMLRRSALMFTTAVVVTATARRWILGGLSERPG